MIAELVNTTSVLLAEIGEPSTKRNDVALTYAMALASSYETDWRAVNSAILDRWSMNALKYIKERAWKLGQARSRRFA